MQPGIVEQSKPVCFVIMPISDPGGYDNGHFGRVYEHILRPAIEAAGYTPQRADDANKTDYIVVGIVRRIIEDSMVLCDLSSKNPNVMYELGLRHAFNKPVTLVRDKATEKVFDIQGLRYTEYDQSLRVDSVQKNIEQITKAIRETANAPATDVNSVVRLAGLKAADPPVDQTISPDTQVLLSAVASLESKVERMVYRGEAASFFHIEGAKIVFEDGTTSSLGESVHDSQFKELGKIVDIHPASEKIFVRDAQGKITPFAAYSIKSRGLKGEIPF